MTDRDQGGRLCVDDWIEAGFEILAEEGLQRLKIDRLCERLGVTKGSFYWHFVDMPSYRARLVEAWGQLRDADRRTYEAAGDLPPRQRLAHMMSALIGPRHWTLERAMREWARSDETVAAGVRTADQRVLAAVRATFRDHGLALEDADMRANATFAAGVGFLHLSGPTPDIDAIARLERFLDFMLRP